jgi:hypothetical protein
VEQKTPPALTLFYPRLMTRARTPGGLDDSEFTGFAVVNLSSTSAALNFTAYDTSGAPISGASLTNPASLRLGAGEQLSLLDAQIFGSELAKRKTAGWMKLESGNARVVGFFLMFNSTLTVLDGADVSSRALTSFVLPEIEDLGLTQISVCNPNDDAAAVRLELLESDGTSRGAVTRTINAAGVLVEDLAALFPGVAPDGSDYVRASSDRGVVSFEFLGKQGRDAEGLNGQDAAAGSAVLYSPQYLVGGSEYRSELSIVNLDSAPGSVTLKFIKEDGTQAGETRVVSIAARGKVHITDQKFFFEPGNTLTQGYLEISSSGPKLAGSVVFSDPAKTRFATALALVSTLRRAVVVSQVVSDATYFTGLSILNPNDSDSRVTIELLDRYGNVLLAKTDSISAKRRRSQLLTQYFPELAGGNITSGYIRLTADQPVAAFALYGTTSLSVLSAVSAQVVP